MNVASKAMIKKYPACKHPPIISGFNELMPCNQDQCVFSFSEGDVPADDWSEVDELLIGSYMYLQCIKASESAIASDVDAALAFKEIALEWRRWAKA